MDTILKIATLLILSLITYSSNAQTTPSQQGFKCNVYHNGWQSYGVGDSFDNAAEESCMTRSDAISRDGNQCHVWNGTQTIELIRTITCQDVAICLTGNGWEEADSSGYCPDPQDGSSGDDDDGDGSDCDAGEEDQLDCNDGDTDDTDTDGDGEPDSADDDDGICSEFNEGDADCPEEEECIAGEQDKFDFKFNAQGYVIPDYQVCSSGCLYDRGNNGDPPTGGGFCLDWFSGETDEQLGYTCQMSKTGETCQGCTGAGCQGSDDGECKEGETRDINGECGPIENFCQLDEHTNGTEDFTPDGIPDNIGTFACGQEGEPEQCDPIIDPDCTQEPVGEYSCEFSKPPVCTGDPIECAIREESYREVCGTKIENTLNCEEEFTCEGDTYECESLKLQRTQYCAFNFSIDKAQDQGEWLETIEGVDDGSNWFGGPEVEGSYIDFADYANQLDDAGFGWPSSCPSDGTITFLNKSYPVEWSRACEILDVIAILVMMSAALISLYIIFGEL